MNNYGFMKPRAGRLSKFKLEALMTCKKPVRWIPGEKPTSSCLAEI